MNYRNKSYILVLGMATTSIRKRMDSKMEGDGWTNMREKNSGDYFKDTYEVICAEFEKPLGDVQLNQKKICDLVSKLINNRKNLKGSAKLMYTDVQSQVSKALKALKEANMVYQIGSLYYPYIPEAMRYILRPKLEELPFNEDGIFFVSSSTVLLSIRGLSKKTTVQEDEEAENDSIDSNICEKILDRKEVKKLFKDYLTDKHCFNVHINNNYVVLLIKGTVNEVEDIGEDLKAIVKKSWEHQNEPKFNFSKRRSSMQIAREKAEKEAQKQTE